MSDAAPDPDSFVAEEELTFGDNGLSDATGAGSEDDPAPATRARKSVAPATRAPRRKRAKPVDDAAPEPSGASPSDAPGPAATESPTIESATIEPTAPATAPAPAQPPVAAPSTPRRDVRTMLLGAIAGCALVSSLASLGGLIAVGRTLAAAQQDRADAAGRAGTLARLPALIARLDAAGARLDATAARNPDGAAPVTLDQLRHEIDGLKAALDQRQPPGLSPLAQSMHDGFGEVGDRLGRIEQALGPRRRSGTETGHP